MCILRSIHVLCGLRILRLVQRLRLLVRSGGNLSAPAISSIGDIYLLNIYLQSILRAIVV